MFPAIVPGAASQSVVIHIMDSTTGLPEQAVEHDSPGISLWYWRPGSTITAITPAALATLDAAYSSGGIEHIDDGDYRLDIPNAAIAAGVPWVAVGGTLTDMIVVGVIVPLNLASAAEVVTALEGTALEGTITWKQAMMLAIARFGGIATGGGTTEIIFKNPAGTKSRVTLTVDASGNVSASSFDFS